MSSITANSQPRMHRKYREPHQIERSLHVAPICKRNQWLRGGHATCEAVLVAYSNSESLVSRQQQYIAALPHVLRRYVQRPIPVHSFRTYHLFNLSSFKHINPITIRYLTSQNRVIHLDRQARPEDTLTSISRIWPHRQSSFSITRTTSADDNSHNDATQPAQKESGIQGVQCIL